MTMAIHRSIMRAILATLALAGCGLTAAQIRERDLCYERADAAAQDRVDRECAESFSTCPTADDIMDELRRAQEACP